MTVEDEPKDEPDEDDDERARRVAAAELQKQIDALVRGDTGAQPEKPRSLRDFIERGGARPSNKSQHQHDRSPDEASPHQAIESDGAGEDDKAR
jgi:hypothetical protein